MGTRVLVVDDNKMMRDGLRVFIGLQDEMEVVAVANDGPSAVRLAADLAPDVVVMDLSMPGESGADATRRMLKDRPRARVVVLSGYSDESLVAEALRAGACGYVMKDAAYEELAGAIRAVMEDRIYLSPRLVQGRDEGFGEAPGVSDPV
jgi:DNA-binding NarL/FixJ family response regulator